MLKVSADGKRQRLLVGSDDDDRIALLQKAVGGYFEHLRVDQDVSLYVDEEAAYKNPRPQTNQGILELFGIRVLGDALVFGGFDACGNELAVP